MQLGAALFAVILGVSVYWFLYVFKRSNIPSHLLDHKLVWQENLIPPDTAVALRELMKDMKTIPSNIAADRRGATDADMGNEDIGEGQSISSVSSNLSTHLIYPICLSRPSHLSR